MKLLLTNDDGYSAPSFQILKKNLEKKHDVFIAAPMNQKSGAGHSVSLFKPMLYNKIDNRTFTIDGSPADCIKAALFGLFPKTHFDLIISGINNGPNMGDDIFYSGTVAGAREASLNGISAIACSVNGYDGKQNFKEPAFYIASLLPILLNKLSTETFILNINFPTHPPYKGTKITQLGKRIYSDQIIFSSDNTKGSFLTLIGDTPSHLPKKGSDLDAVHAGFVSVTPLSNETAKSDIHDKLSSLSSEINRFLT